MKLLRNYIIVLSAVAIVAVGLAFLSVRGYLTKPTVVVVSHSDPLLVSEEGETYDDLVPLLTYAKKNATKVEQLPLQPHGYPTYGVQTKTKSNRLVGAYYLHVISMINRTAVLEDLLTGEYYQISVADFEALLCHEAFSQLSQTQIWNQPLTVGDFSEILATSEAIYFYDAKGAFQPVPNTEAEITQTFSMTTEEVSSKPLITAPLMPDAWSLTVQKDETTVVTQDRVDASELYFPTEPGDYTYRLTAHWDMTTQRDWYGDLNYVLEIHIAEPEAE